MDWPWPGNVRELQNFVERSVILTRNETLAAPISELTPSALPKESPGHGARRDLAGTARRPRKNFRNRGRCGAARFETNHPAAQDAAA